MMSDLLRLTSRLVLEEERLGDGEIERLGVESPNLSIAESPSARRFRGRLVAAGVVRDFLDEPGRYQVLPEAIAEAVENGRFEALACFVDHADSWIAPSLRDLFGYWSEVIYDGETQTAEGVLVVYETDGNRPMVQLLDAYLASAERPDIGISLVFYPVYGDDERTLIRRFRKIESADLVFMPAVGDARITSNAAEITSNVMTWPMLSSRSRLVEFDISKGERLMSEAMTVETMAAGAGEGLADPQPWLKAMATAAATAMIRHAGLPPVVEERLLLSDYRSPEEVDAAIERARAELALLNEAGVVQLPGRPPRQSSRQLSRELSMLDPLDEAARHVAFFFGAPGAAAPPPNLRRFDDLYMAMTGDYEFRGIFHADRVLFSGATTATLANLAVDAMNKVIVEQFRVLDHWRWYERVVSVEPNDGTLQDMKWITLGGLSNLPTVAEGASYTELDVDDVKESAAFVKKGGYVGITREMIRNSDIMRLQAIPRALAAAAVRTRSAAVSAIFTDNAGVGPTLAQDSTALFHATHSNVATTALGTDATAWRAARAECFQHTEVQSGKVLGIYPHYLLVPAELYDTALSILGYGEGMPTTYAPEAQGRGFADPRAIPLVVPDWTDATDWAYAVEPLVYPVIQMSYSQNPGGRLHPAPELFTVISEAAGLMFTNDVLPIKVRDEFAVGVNGPRGIGKRNVA